MVDAKTPPKVRRPVYLIGFMGTGKSTAGAALAARLRLPFLDTDALLTLHTGIRIAEYFKTHGEAAFRIQEQRLLEEQLADPSPRVVALGGGALLSRSLRLRALQQATVLCLKASPEELERRLLSSAQRPLLTGDAGEYLRTLLALREESYAECHASLNTEGLSLEQTVERLEDLLRRVDLVVAAGRRSYPIQITQGAPDLSFFLKEQAPSSAFLVTDSNVAQHHGGLFPVWMEGVPWETRELEPGETSKKEHSLGLLWRDLLEAGLDRKGLLLGVGGGVVTDLTGLAAGTWLRGVRWLAVPTSLLGMVDAAVGGKTAIDLEGGKNVVGLFSPPVAVCVGTGLLATEPERSFRSGLAEVVKTALLGDAVLLGVLEENQDAILRRDPALLERVVRASMAVKAGIVSRDEQEQGERRLLNLGHTLGHALEAAGGFQRWTHGEAVALGLGIALRMGEALGITEAGLTERVERLLAGLGLPWRVDPQEIERALPFLRNDKKRERDDLHFVLVRRLGEAQVKRLSLVFLQEVLRASSLLPLSAPSPA